MRNKDGRKIQAVSGSVEQGFQFTDVTQFVDHLFDYRIKQMVYQEEPYSLVWVIDRSISTLNLSYNLFWCRFNPEEDNDFAWHKHEIGRAAGISSLATFPSIDQGQTDLWFLVFRGENKSLPRVRFAKLERFHARHNCSSDGIDALKEDL